MVQSSTNRMTSVVPSFTNRAVHLTYDMVLSLLGWPDTLDDWSYDLVLLYTSWCSVNRDCWCLFFFPLFLPTLTLSPTLGTKKVSHFQVILEQFINVFSGCKSSVGLNSKQRQRVRTDWWWCRLHLLSIANQLTLMMPSSNSVEIYNHHLLTHKFQTVKATVCQW